MACLGACALAPVMVIDGDYHGHLDDAAALAVIDKYASSGDGAEDNDADGN
ncbi:MAG TPA: NAD(P)H-dependent oxidoreductase subunit E [Armatimonadota bacterium]|nr:NAD(P)H-dependent oxidoreductase subunit E [Armatimonadota bacterium]